MSGLLSVFRRHETKKNKRESIKTTAMKKTLLFAMALAAICIMPSCGKDPKPGENGSTVTGTLNGHDYVDLGLPSGTLWATCNIGAAASEESGDYFSWGETSPKEDYSWDTYQFGKWGSSFTKYFMSPFEGYPGFADNLKVLEECDDAASVLWGGGWHIPTYRQWKELINNCTLDGPHVNGTNDWAFVGPNGNRLVLPFAGFKGGTTVSGYHGYYWSSSLYAEYPDDSGSAWLFYNEGNEYDMSFDFRNLGLTIRPVHPAE